MAKKRIFTISFLSIVGLMLAFGGYWVFASLFSVDKTIPAEKLAKVEQGSIAKSVVATGKVEPLSKVEIKSKASGIIKYLYVNAGDTVREGSSWSNSTRRLLEAQLKEARAFLDAAEGKLKEIDSQGKTLQANLHKSQLEAENKDYDFAVAEYKRYRELYAQGLVSKSEFRLGTSRR